MKNFHKLIGIVLSLTLMTLISGCGGGGEGTSSTASNTGTVSLRLTDAPTDDKNVKGVYVKKGLETDIVTFIIAFLVGALFGKNFYRMLHMLHKQMDKPQNNHF